MALKMSIEGSSKKKDTIFGRSMRAKDITLVILAGGIGSRYGGDKQIAKLGPNGEWLMEYALFDAFKVGCSKAVLVIRDELQSQLEDHLLPRWSDRLSIEFARQARPNDREKPWGTAHATLAARNRVDGPFILVNADDFYGSSAFAALYDFLSGCKLEQSEWGDDLLSTRWDALFFWKRLRGAFVGLVNLVI